LPADGGLSLPRQVLPDNHRRATGGSIYHPENRVGVTVSAWETGKVVEVHRDEAAAIRIGPEPRSHRCGGGVGSCRSAPGAGEAAGRD
jgi:hypothetical protein